MPDLKKTYGLRRTNRNLNSEIERERKSPQLDFYNYPYLGKNPV